MMKLCLFAILFFTGIASFNCKSIDSNDCGNVCRTPGCIHEAARTLDMMDQTVDPCENFYNFACGKFVNETIIPDEKGSVSQFSIVNDKLQEELHSLLSDRINPNDPAPFNLAKKLHKTCMNRTQIEANGLKPLREITDKLGGWPVIKGDEWNTKSVWNWTWAIKEFRKFGFGTDYIFSLSIDVDFKNSTAHVIAIDQASLGLARPYLVEGFDDDIVKAYYQYMLDVAVIMGANHSRAEQELKESLEFEMKLANISLPSEKRRNLTSSYNPYTLREVQKMYPYIQWIDYINAFLTSKQSVDENEVILVYVPSYFKKLNEVLRDTPNRTIANYMMWRITSYSTQFLNSELRSRRLVFDTALYGVQEQEPRWRECTYITYDSFSMPVGAMYIRKYFPKESKAAAIDIILRIRNEFKAILKDTKWMDDETRKAALNKLEALSLFVGYPDEMLNNSKIEKYYKNIDIDENNLLLSCLKVNVYDTDLSVDDLREPYNKSDWINHADTAFVNAYNAFSENSIDIPAGILRGNFFSADRPKYSNYGEIGAVIGHEITHGFDNRGSKFDLHGNLVNWWQPATRSRFLEKAKCIIEQYGNFTEPVTGLKLNGIKTEGENIADNGGFKIAYYAYLKWQKENGPEQQLPGLNYNPQQMFWLSVAQIYCSKYRPETMKSAITSDVHSPGPFRILGPLRNRPEFAADFNCKEGSPMNPAKKCDVW